MHNIVNTHNILQYVLSYVYCNMYCHMYIAIYASVDITDLKRHCRRDYDKGSQSIINIGPMYTLYRV